MQRINLENLKASGVYTFEYDASQTLSETTEYGRLLIGSSKAGPFNTIVQLNNDAQKRAIFGANDRLLEKKGSYFHKAIEISLSEGPVYAMNVLPIDTVSQDSSNKDKGYVTTFNTDSATDISGDNIDTPVMFMFDRQKFWKSSEEALLRVKNSKTNPYVPLAKFAENILLFSNASQRSVTIFVQKSSVTGYDLTVSEWYKSLGDDVYIPTFLSDDDLISDYMVNVIAVSGDWTNYKKLSSDPVYSRYFDSTGLIKSRAAEFLQMKTVNVLVNVTGSLIPEFKDDRGSIIAVDRLFNNYYPSTQLMCAIDADSINEFDPNNNPDYDSENIGSHRIDIVGNGVEECKSNFVNILSYNGPIKNSVSVFDTAQQSEYTVNSDDAIFVEGSEIYTLWNSGYLLDGSSVVKLNPDGSETDEVRYIKSSYEEEVIKSEDPNVDDIIVKKVRVSAYYDIDLKVKDPDPSSETDDPFFVEESQYKFNLDKYGQEDLYQYFKIDNDRIIYNENIPNELRIRITGYLNPDYEKQLKDTKRTSVSPYIGWVEDLVKYVKVNNYLKADTDGCAPRYLKIMSVARITDNKGTSSTADDETYLVIKTMAPVSEKVKGIKIDIDPETNQYVITASKGIQNFTKSLTGKLLSPFKIDQRLLPNGTPERVEEILKFLFDGSNLASAISESEEVDIRYLVDTYDGEISANSKMYITKLAATHGKCMAFVNAPSMKQFEQSTDPKFIDAQTGLLKTEYISTGGNLDLNPSFVYKFASDTVRGMPIETFCVPCTPYLIINDGGVKRSMIPSPYVCNAYMRKFKMNAPYVIVAGVNTGKLTENDILGVEYEFTKSDREWLEPAGYNIIIQRRRDGIMLFSNNTAYQSVKSALNNAHVRDTLITLEKRIEKILFSFLFRYNTEVVRSRVKSLVDNYLETVKLAGGIASYETQIDAVNNDQYVIENNSAILDVKVDFPRGIHKFVNRITITRAGGELSVVQSGFTDL